MDILIIFDLKINSMNIRKQEAFKGQRTIILPELIIREIKQDPLRYQLHLTDIGFYPNAQHHQRLREEG